MNKLLFSDAAGPQIQKLYGNSHYALAALVPASLVSPSDGMLAKVADLGLAVAIPLHSHVALGYGKVFILVVMYAASFTVCIWVRVRWRSTEPSCSPGFAKSSIAHLLFAVVADYVPRGLQVPARFGVVGLTGVMGLGLLKLSLMGPGIGGEWD